MNSGEPFQLIDVREYSEYMEDHMFGALIPMGSLVDRRAEISSDKKVVIHCRSGRRSADIIRILEDQFHYQNLYNLEGGILAWNHYREHSK